MRNEETKKTQEKTSKPPKAPKAPKVIYDYGATQGDIRELRMEIKADMHDLRNELKGDINNLRVEIKDNMHELKSDMKWLIGGLYGLTALGFVALGIIIKFG